MKYKVALHESEEGFSVWVPGLPGCVSQGDTEEEALTNIADAIAEYLSVITSQLEGAEIREIEVAAQAAGRESSRRSSSAREGWVSNCKARQDKHIVMTDASHTVTIPRHNPVNAYTMGRIALDAGLKVEDFRRLL